MSPPTVDPALAGTDPVGYVEAVAAVAINDEDPRWREQAALWRSVTEWHGRGLGEFDWCTTCGRMNGSIKFPCPNLRATVAAARAYAGGAP